MSYFWKIDGISRDELSGGGDGIPQEIINVNVGASAAIERGMLMCGASYGGTFAQVSSSADASKILGIAVNDFDADADHTVTQIYTSGKYNLEKIGCPSGVNIEDFIDPLRKSNIHVTSIKDVFGKVNY